MWASNPHTKPRWILEKANWDLYQDIVRQNFPNLPKPGDRPTPDVNDLTASFQHLLLDAAKASIPKTSGKIRPRQVPWWNEECSNAVRAKRGAYRKFRRTPSLENGIEFRLARAKARSMLKSSMLASWQNFTASIPKDTPPSTLWKKVTAIKGSRAQVTHPQLIDANGELHSDPAKTSALLASTFAKNSANANYHQEFQARLSDISSPPYAFEQHLLADVSEDYNLPLTQEELLFALHNSRNSSPGPDDIPTGFLKNLPKKGLSYLLEFYNFIWNSQCFPDKWREAETIAIPKPNKDHIFPANFRPISLTCTMCKLLEKKGV